MYKFSVQAWATKPFHSRLESCHHVHGQDRIYEVFLTVNPVYSIMKIYLWNTLKMPTLKDLFFILEAS